MSQLHVVLDLFSGLPNPRWTLDADAARELVRRVGALAPRTGAPDPPSLGYRGLVVEQAGPRSAASMRFYRGTVFLSDRQLTDPDRALERWLVGTHGGELSEVHLAVVEADFPTTGDAGPEP